MAKDYPLKKEFLTWLQKKKNIGKPGTYVSDIQRILEKHKNKYVQKYLHYVPALLFIEKKEMAKQLLACVYADACYSNESKYVSYLKRYCEFLAKSKKMPKVPLNDNELQDIKDYLDSRQVWIVEDKVAKNLKAIGGDKASTFNELFNIRIYSWGRPNFPLDIIKKEIENDNFMSDWVGQIRNCIEVVIDKSGKRTKLNNIKAFDFRKHEQIVYAIEKQDVKYTVFTPLADSNDYKEMKIAKLGEMSIDHEYPLDAIVKSIARGEGSELQKIIAKDCYGKDYDVSDNPLHIDKDKLKEEMTIVRKATSYVLMAQSENSRKSNYTSFKRIIIEKNGFKYIVAENVVGIDNNLYRVYFTDKDATMKLEPMNK